MEGFQSRRLEQALDNALLSTVSSGANQSAYGQRKQFDKAGFQTRCNILQLSVALERGIGFQRFSLSFGRLPDQKGRRLCGA
jgi:hypothetical protein